jgi:transcriptional regulator with XRE-family HTH domain
MNGALRIINSEDLLRLLDELKDPDYRNGFIEGHAKDTIAFQLRQLRKAKEWDQRDLANALGNPKLQPMISRYENPDYGRYSITTLLELAKALDVALVVRFASLSELVEWDWKATDETLLPATYSDDRGLLQLAEAASHEHPIQFNLGGSSVSREIGLGGVARQAANVANSTVSPDPQSPQETRAAMTGMGSLRGAAAAGGAV